MDPPSAGGDRLNENRDLTSRMESWLGQEVVIDIAHPFVAIGTLAVVTRDYLELNNADMHDLRDTATTRENYVVKTRRHGIGVNRRVVVLRMDQVIGVTPLGDVVDQ